MKNINLLIEKAADAVRILDSGIEVLPHSPIHQQLKDALEALVKKSKSKKPALTPEQEAELPARIEQYNEIFPEKTKIPTSGKYARSAPRELIDGFRWFLLNNPQYGWDIILQATQIYVDQKRSDNWNYMRTSQYFIRKQNNDKTWISDLANYCQQVLDGEASSYSPNTNTAFKENIV